MYDSNLCNNCEYINHCNFWDGENKTFCRKGIELCEISKKENDKERKKEK